MKRTYWIRTGAGRGETEPKWIQLSGQEFYAFIHSEEGNGRYFIRLFDETDPECEDILIEAGRKDYEAWKKDYDRHRYLNRTRKGMEVVPLDTGREDGAGGLPERLARGEDLESLIAEKDERERLRNAVALLDSEERQIIFELYLKEDPAGIRQTAERLGMTASALYRKKEKILKKIKKMMRNKPGKNSES